MIALVKGMTVLSDMRSLCKARGCWIFQRFEEGECFVTDQFIFSPSYGIASGFFKKLN